MYATDPEARRVIDVAKGLEGLRRQDGIHAAAVVITKEPLTEYLPVQRKPESGQDPAEAPIVTQYEMHGVEELGCSRWTSSACATCRSSSGPSTWSSRDRGTGPTSTPSPSTTRATFAMLRRGDSIGVFQLEGGPMRSLMRSLAPTSLRRRRRPGRPVPAGADGGQHAPRLRRPQERPASRSRYLHPDLEAILGDTYGLMIYQESVMRVAQRFAGYTLAEADNLRKACGKKIRAMIQAEREKFVAGCVRPGLRGGARHRPCSTSSSRSPTTPSTSPTPTATGWSPTRRRG